MSKQEVQARPTKPDGSENFGNNAWGPSEADKRSVNSLKDFASDEKGISKAGVAVGAGAAVLGAVGLTYAATHQEAPGIVANTSPTPDKTVIPTQSVKVEVSVSPSPTVEPPKSPEVKDVPCQVLPIETCSLGERVTYQSNGKTYTYIGVNLPADSRIPIYAAAEGHLLIGKEGGNPFNGSSLIIKDSLGDNYVIRGNIDTSKFGNLTGADVKRGEIIGYGIPTSAKSLGYDIVVSISKATPTGPETQEEKLKNLFPATYNRPAKEYNIQGEIKPGVIIVYDDSK